MRKILIKIISLKDKRLNERKIIEENNNDEWIKGLFVLYLLCFSISPLIIKPFTFLFCDLMVNRL